MERKEGGACFKEIKVNFTNVDKRRFSNKPNREISRGVLQNRGVCGQAFPLLPSPPLVFFFFFLFFFVTGELAAYGRMSTSIAKHCGCKIFKMAAKVVRSAHGYEG